MSNQGNFIGMLASLKNTSSESLLFTSCEAELQELMRQIDIMVENKRFEWECQVQDAHLQIEKKARDVTKLSKLLEKKEHEIGKLQQELEGAVSIQQDIRAQFEERVDNLKSELDKVKREYGKLQNKYNDKMEEQNQQIEYENQKNLEESLRLQERIEELEDKLANLQMAYDNCRDKFEQMEGQRKVWTEKSEAMQNQLLGYQGQLARKKQHFEHLERSQAAEIAALMGEITQCNEDARAKEREIERLKELSQKNQSELNRLIGENSEIKRENEDLQDLLKDKDHLINKLQREKSYKCKDVDKGVSISSYSSLRSEKLQDLPALVERLKNDLKRKEEQYSNLLVTERKLQDKISSLERKVMYSMQSTERDTSCSPPEKYPTESIAAEKDDIAAHIKQTAKLQAQLESNEQRHASEISGMKSKIECMIEDLHRREIAMATLTENTATMERELREAINDCSKKDAELQIAHAQLEALRLENRHLRDNALTEQISITDDLRLYESHIGEMKHENARVVSTLEEENRSLKQEITLLREELTTLESSNVEQHRCSIDEEATLGENDARSEALGQPLSPFKDPGVQTGQEEYIIATNVEGSLSDYKGGNSGHDNIRVIDPSDHRCSNNLQSEVDQIFEDIEAFADSAREGSRRASITADFREREKSRELELEKLLSDRIAELEKRTREVLDAQKL